MIYIKFLQDVVCQKLLQSANVSRVFQKIASVVLETRCTINDG